MRFLYIQSQSLGSCYKKLHTLIFRLLTLVTLGLSGCSHFSWVRHTPLPDTLTFLASPMQKPPVSESLLVEIAWQTLLSTAKSAVLTGSGTVVSSISHLSLSFGPASHILRLYNYHQNTFWWDTRSFSASIGTRSQNGHITIHPPIPISYRAVYVSPSWPVSSMVREAWISHHQVATHTETTACTHFT